MSLEPGHKLSHYEILEPIGQGGMGEVYRAKDSKLGRDVAIKVLPDEFASDEERRRRFQREAKVLASLNHPNIASIYGLEQSRGTHYLVLELVPGETLAERIARGPIPVDEALEIATKVAEALEEAHERGIVHRDLKPANVKLTEDGKIKVLDFGLAKAFAEETPEVDSSMSPTITRDATRAGVILGTAAYMSPEQAKGKRVDKRSDIFAFGAVVYEMLTGWKAFPGEDVSEVLAAIIKLEPDWSAAPPHLSALVCRCLEKDPTRRYRDIGDVRNDLERALEGDEEEPATTLSGGPPRWLAVGLAAGIASAITAVLAGMLTTDHSPRAMVTRFAISLPEGQQFSNTGRHVVAFSPDGTRIIYAANSQLHEHRLDTGASRPIPGTEGGWNPFFSPEGDWIGFYDGARLRKMSLSGGAPVTLCQAGNPFGVSWGAEDTIVFGQGGQGIFRVSADGGDAELLIEPEDVSTAWLAHPRFLPGGNVLLYTASEAAENWDEATIMSYSLRTGEHRVLLRGGADARYAPAGKLVYARGETVMAVPFSVEELAVTGGPVVLMGDVMRSSAGTGAAQLAWSDEGHVVRMPSTGVKGRLLWTDREGSVDKVIGPARQYSYPRISPDDRRIAVTVTEEGFWNIWIYDLEQETWARPFEGLNERPAWSPDGQWLAFSSSRDDTTTIWRQRADGTGTPEQLTTGDQQHLDHWSPDGEFVVFHEHPGDVAKILLLDGDGEAVELGGLNTSFFGGARFSPDGRYMAYNSEQSGRPEIFIRPFPGPSGATQISTGGGVAPRWSESGELFYRSMAGDMMAVAVSTSPALHVGSSESLFAAENTVDNYDVSSDGERFLLLESSPESAQLEVVLNWFQELERLVPTGK